jgi:superfamily II DNA or RNA helicase
LASLADVAQLIVIDEAHQAIAETYSSVLEVLAKNKDSRILGLTATPGRTWNDPLRDAELADFFHKNKVTLQMPGYISPIDYLIDEGFLAKPLFETMQIDSPKGMSASELEEINKALEIPQSVLVRLSQDEVRNLRIIAKLEELIGRHKRILFFASTVQHSDLISAILIARGVNAKSVTSKTLLADRQRYLNNFISDDPNPVILCNFGVLTTGFDAPKTSCVVIARPTKSLVLYSQMVGRGTRGPKMGGTKECEVVTVVDTFLPGFGDMSEAFRNWEDVW